jgi:hypothetical protein
MSEWLDIMLQEIGRKNAEAVAAAEEQQRRSQERYERKSSGKPLESEDSVAPDGSGAEL